MELAALLRHVETETGAVANLEALHPAFFEAASLRLAPDQYLHHGEHCRRVKLSSSFPLCSENKRRAVEIARRGRVFSGCCPFGLWDMAFPLLVDGSLACVVFLGGFRAPGVPLKSPGDMAQLERRAPFIDGALKAKLRKWGAFISEFIDLELALWRKSGGGKGKRKGDEFYYELCKRVIDCRFAEKGLSLSGLADELKSNANYLGGLLKRKNGKGFRQVLNERRVEEAKVYLRLHKKLKISRVAALCGFEDGNYFSVVFRRCAGMTPLEFRNSGGPKPK